MNESQRLETLWVNQEVAGLMDDFDVNVQFDAALEAGAGGLILWPVKSLLPLGFTLLLLQACRNW